MTCFESRRTTTRGLATAALAMALAAGMLGACGGDDDGPGATDAGRDATSIDLGAPPDMSRDDASAEDASAEDASAEDASAEDASAEDASAEDASADASPDDASSEDANVDDADVDAGDAARDCEMVACLRAFECVRACGEEPFYVGCCPCPEGTLDAPVDCRGDAGPGLPAGELCGGDRGVCGAGLSCCYPCGIPGCDNICEPTCDESTPGCAGGCLLRP